MCLQSNLAASCSLICFEQGEPAPSKRLYFDQVFLLKNGEQLRSTQISELKKQAFPRSSKICLKRRYIQLLLMFSSYIFILQYYLRILKIYALRSLDFEHTHAATLLITQPVHFCNRYFDLLILSPPPLLSIVLVLSHTMTEKCVSKVIWKEYPRGGRRDGIYIYITKKISPSS